MVIRKYDLKMKLLTRASKKKGQGTGICFLNEFIKIKKLI